MYTHARQFPHMVGKSDSETRLIVAREMTRRPALIRTMQIRNAAVILLMLLSVLGLTSYAGLKLGPALLTSGAVATAFVLLWNVVWVNTVAFKITRPETTNR